MTGPEHYSKAEELSEKARTHNSEYLLAAAQVHATLALAAATAQGHLPVETPLADLYGWEEALR